MKVRIDGAGRIVVPKGVRDRLGLRPNMELDLIEQPDGALIRAPEERSGLFWDGGLLIHRGEPEKGARWESIVDDVREERLRSILS